MADNPFEIPKQMRDLAEQNVQQARAAYGQFLSVMNQAMGMWFGAMPSNAMTSSFKTVQERASQMAKKNADAAFALADDIATARDLQEIFKLQTEFAQSQMQAYATQAQELTRLMAEAAQSSTGR